MHGVAVRLVEAITLDMMALPHRQVCHIDMSIPCVLAWGVLHPTAWPRGVFVLSHSHAAFLVQMFGMHAHTVVRACPRRASARARVALALFRLQVHGCQIEETDDLIRLGPGSAVAQASSKKQNQCAPRALVDGRCRWPWPCRVLAWWILAGSRRAPPTSSETTRSTCSQRIHR